MTVDFNWSHRRDEWEEPGYRVADHTNSPAFPWGSADRIVIHYTGAEDVPDGDPDEMPWETHVSAYLRAIQRHYVDHPDRGYSVGYNMLVTQDGDDWQLRGIDWMCAANSGWNGRTFAILVFVDGADKCTAEAIRKIRDVVAWFRARSPYGEAVQVVGHRDIGSTPCPGIGVYSQIVNQVFEPVKDVLVSELHFKKERVFDSRQYGNPTASGGQVITLGAPAGALAVKVNLTAVGAAGRGYVTAYPAGAKLPETSDLNYRDAAAICNQVDVPVRGGQYSLYVSYPTHIVVDLVGYWT